MVQTSRSLLKVPLAKGAAGLAVAAIFLFERQRPLRRQDHPALPRNLLNLAMGMMCASVVSVIETPVTQRIARANRARKRGLAGLVPSPLAPMVAFFGMDYGFYLWHVATHKSAWLWRFHRVHHVDPDMDMSTAIRFHMIDMLVSLPWRMVQVRLSGIGPRTLENWQRFFTLSILFHHSNLKLPGGWDRRLSWLLTTPEMHGIHHSAVPDQRDSNWSSGISIWDRLHRTYRIDMPASDVTIGVADRCALHDVAVEPAMAAPFLPSARLS